MTLTPVDVAQFICLGGVYWYLIRIEGRLSRIEGSQTKAVNMIAKNFSAHHPPDKPPEDSPSDVK
jgi:hypothetical protein